MKCPADGSELKMSDRQGVEIDYCPQCRGVWLDRGELDKIIERSASFTAAKGQEDEGYVPTGGRPVPPDRQDYDDRRRDPYYDERRRHEDPNYYKRRKRKSFLEDLFDFD